MSKCQHPGCNFTMSSGEYCHRHLPVLCPLCNQILSGLLDAEQKHGPNRCVISMDAYRAVETQLASFRNGAKVYEAKIAELQKELKKYE